MQNHTFESFGLIEITSRDARAITGGVTTSFLGALAEAVAMYFLKRVA